ALVEVHNPDNVNTNMINQAVQAMPSFEQLNVVNQSETKITSDILSPALDRSSRLLRL
ncbi:hypothetical protein Tco_0420269, partial [Tanacetum coccineum]